MSKVIFQKEPLFPKILWNRPVHHYKAGAGKILVISGSKGKEGRALLVCEAVFRSGTGILLLAYPEGLRNHLKDIITDAMSLPLPETLNNTLSIKAKELILENSLSCDAVIIGPGLSTNPETVHLSWELISELNRPLVIAHEGVSAFISGLDVMQKKESFEYMQNYLAGMSGEKVFVINNGDFRRLADIFKQGKITPKITPINLQEALKSISKTLNATVVYASSPLTVVTSNGDLIKNQGSDLDQELSQSQIDALSGVIGSFVGQNPNKVSEAVTTAIYIFDKAIMEATSNEPKKLPNISGSSIVSGLNMAIKKAESI